MKTTPPTDKPDDDTILTLALDAGFTPTDEFGDDELLSFAHALLSLPTVETACDAESPTPVLDSIEQDAQRFRFLTADPETWRHLLSLLNQGKGDVAALRRMIDRIQVSKAGITK